MHRSAQRQAKRLPQGGTLTRDAVTIGELARVTGFNAKAIRYYEQIGILPPSSRGKNGYRQYSQADINRLNLLRRLRLLGISLEEAKTLLGATLDAPCYEVQHDLLHLVNARLATIDQEIAELHHLREEVVRCQQQLVVSAVEKDEPFTVCYDQTCLACSPTSALPHRPLTLVARGQTRAQKDGGDQYSLNSSPFPLISSVFSQRSEWFDDLCDHLSLHRSQRRFVRGCVSGRTASIPRQVKQPLPMLNNCTLTRMSVLIAEPANQPAR